MLLSCMQDNQARRAHHKNFFPGSETVLAPWRRRRHVLLCCCCPLGLWDSVRLKKLARPDVVLVLCGPLHVDLHSKAKTNSQQKKKKWRRKRKQRREKRKSHLCCCLLSLRLKKLARPDVVLVFMQPEPWADRAAISADELVAQPAPAITRLCLRHIINRREK